MANKLPWFTHDHNARNDDFIHRAEGKFGHFGYAGWFKLLEVLHEHGVGDVLMITKGRLSQELRSRWPQVHLLLDFCRTSGKLEFNLKSDEVELQIKKFRERQSKLKFNLLSTFHQPSINTPQQEERDREREVKTTAPSGAVVAQRTPTGLQKVIRAYKVAKGLDPDDSAWDKANFKVHAKAAKKLLEAFGGNEKNAMTYMIGLGYDWDQDGVKWVLATAAKHAWDDKRRLDATGTSGGELGKPDDKGQVGADRSLDARGPARITLAGSVAQETLGAIGRLHTGLRTDGGEKSEGGNNSVLAGEDE